MSKALYNEEVIHGIRQQLLAAGKTVAVAESVTAGHMQAALSSALEASRFFQGGITVYNLGQKCRHLAVDPIIAADCDCVSEVVAVQMAKEANRLFASHYAIAITGYAAKMPEKGQNELYAFFAVAEQNKILVVEKITTNHERVEGQIEYANKTLAAFEKLLHK